MWLLAVALLAVSDTNAGARAIDAAIASMDDLEYQVAADTLTAALAGDLTDDERMKANLLAGIAQRIIGNDTAARMHFLWVLHRDPNAQLPARAETQSPKLTTFFELVRAEVVAATPEPVVAPPPVPEAESPPWVAVGVSGVSVLALVAGAAVALAADQALVDPAPLDERRTIQNVGRVGLVGAGVGAIGVIAGAMLFVSGAP